MEMLQLLSCSEYFPSDRYISYDKAVKNISMVLLNSHFTQGSVRPYVPAMVEVGGITVKPTPDPLPNVRPKNPNP
jgi:glucuronosyltransferase